MASDTVPNDPPNTSSSSSNESPPAAGGDQPRPPQRRVEWKQLLGVRRDARHPKGTLDNDSNSSRREKSTMGIMSDKETDEVPGTVVLLAARRNEPLGLNHQSGRQSASSLPPQYPRSRQSSTSRSAEPQQKRTADGQIVLDPQPDDSLNDPLNWPVWKRDLSLVSLGLHCMLGGGMTTVLAAAYHNVMDEYSVTSQQVAFTTSLYMLGLGLGSVIMSPTAILWGKRPVYVGGAVLFALSAIWCAASPTFPSLLVARIFQGVAVSPVECLPSATIAEIFFLHERAYRVGIYTFLLLGGKNLVPLASAAITQSLGWRWIFWVVAIVVGFCLCLLFFFVPETFWDRTPRPRPPRRRPSFHRSVSDRVIHGLRGRSPNPVPQPEEKRMDESPAASRSKRSDVHVDFANGPADENEKHDAEESQDTTVADNGSQSEEKPSDVTHEEHSAIPVPRIVMDEAKDTPTVPCRAAAPQPGADLEAGAAAAAVSSRASRDVSVGGRSATSPLPPGALTAQQIYTRNLRKKPQLPYVQSLKLWNGRIARDKWLRVMCRPFILFAYPAVLWAAAVYALSVGWLIMISETVTDIYRSDTYNFSALGVGLVYISPFVGGLLGTAVAGKVSDIVARWMTRRNGGIYEPEFRLVMAIPIAITTAMGLMGYGWSVQEKERWIVPTVFFGILSFGCTLGSTTSITFCVDSYRQYAGEALVTLNFSKNIFHGFVFGLFFVDWLHTDGSKDVFVTVGGIHLAFMLFTIPMYRYGKRLRMWTVRKKMMEKW